MKFDEFTSKSRLVFCRFNLLLILKINSLSDKYAFQSEIKLQKKLFILINCIDLPYPNNLKTYKMRTKSTILVIALLFTMSMSFAQKDKNSIAIITGKVSISKYHSYEDLNQMSKGKLLELYTERIEVIVNILPNIAFATKPGVTMKDLGIPETKENKKALEESREAAVDYFDSTVAFQRTILPYSDTRDLISAIIFYEETLKSLHTYNDFKND